MNTEWIKPSIEIIASDLLDIELPESEVIIIAERLIDNFTIEEGITPDVIEQTIQEVRAELKAEAKDLAKELGA